MAIELNLIALFLKLSKAQYLWRFIINQRQYAGLFDDFE